MDASSQLPPHLRRPASPPESPLVGLSLRQLRQFPLETSWAPALARFGFVIIREDETSDFFLESVFVDWARQTFALPQSGKRRLRGYHRGGADEQYSVPGPHCREFCGNPKTVCAGIFLGHSYGAAILHHLALTLPPGHRELRVDRSRSVFTATGGGARSPAVEPGLLRLILGGSDAAPFAVRDRAGAWRDVPVPPGHVAVVGGHALEVASGGVYVAATHRLPERGFALKIRPDLGPGPYAARDLASRESLGDALDRFYRKKTDELEARVAVGDPASATWATLHLDLKAIDRKSVV